MRKQAEEGRERCGRFVPFSSGGYLRSFQRQRVSPAPDGASCENHPRIRPYLVVAPSGAAFWACYRAPTTALQPPLPRRGACARKVPTWRLNCRCPSARRRWRCASRFPTASPWGRGRRGRRSRPKPRRGKVPRLSAALLVSIRVCSVGRVRTRQKWRGARRCRGV